MLCYAYHICEPLDRGTQRNINQSNRNGGECVNIAWGRQCRANMMLKGMTYNDLVELTGYSRIYLSKVINGKKQISEQALRNISKALEVDPKLYK